MFVYHLFFSALPSLSIHNNYLITCIKKSQLEEAGPALCLGIRMVDGRENSQQHHLKMVEFDDLQRKKWKYLLLIPNM
jgi:hypothetical protein